MRWMLRKEGSKTSESKSFSVLIVTLETKKPLGIEGALWFVNPWDVCPTTLQRLRTNDDAYLNSQKTEFTVVSTVSILQWGEQ